MSDSNGFWRKWFGGKSGARRIFDLAWFLIIIVVCCLCYYKGDLSFFLAIALALVLFVIHFGMRYLDYYDENLYWDDVSPNGYLFHKTYDIQKKKNSFALVAKPACSWVVGCLSFTGFAFLVFDILARFHGGETSFLNIAILFLFNSLAPIIARYQEGKRNINFDKKLKKFWRGGKVDSVWDFAKWSDVVGLEKIKDFSIVRYDRYYDLEMLLDDSKKIKLISNADMEYLKKIEGELREFLELK